MTLGLGFSPILTLTLTLTTQLSPSHQVGWMSDPRQLPGLAHFCEHMLFLGTSGFPEEGDFDPNPNS